MELKITQTSQQAAHFSTGLCAINDRDLGMEHRCAWQGRGRPYKASLANYKSVHCATSIASHQLARAQATDACTDLPRPRLAFFVGRFIWSYGIMWFSSATSGTQRINNTDWSSICGSSH